MTSNDVSVSTIKNTLNLEAFQVLTKEIHYIALNPSLESLKHINAVPASFKTEEHLPTTINQPRNPHLQGFEA